MMSICNDEYIHKVTGRSSVNAQAKQTVECGTALLVGHRAACEQAAHAERCKHATVFAKVTHSARNRLMLMHSTAF